MIWKVLALFLLPAFAFGSPLPNSNTNWIYSHSCKHRFLEGKTVTRQSISCTSELALGFLDVNYTFYLYSDHNTDNNFHHRGTTISYPTFCNLYGVNQAECDPTSVKREFGLAKTMTDPYNLSIFLQPSPNAAAELVGFAAARDEEGYCPEGSIPFTAYKAIPPSIYHPLPTNFINEYGQLNGLVLKPVHEQPEPMVITRTPGTKPCINNECHMPDGETSKFLEVPYLEEPITFCAKPAR